MTNFSRWFLRIALSTGLIAVISVAQANLDSTSRERIQLGLPEITTALDQDYQVQARLVLKLSGPRAEKMTKDKLVRLRHALVLQLAGQDPQRLDAEGIETAMEDFRLEANSLIGAPNAIQSVLVQKFVVQAK
jgi:flagellar basal body-associated protein FliL